MEKDIIPKHGIKYVGLNVKGLNRKNIFENFLVVYLYYKSNNKI
jgi:UDP-N-acetylglucosamine:LPS N-acetylglucosamine transferase